MERKVAERFEEWKNSADRKALLVRGFRQVGKTYSILEFARTHYKNVVYIDFDTNPEYSGLFSNGMSAPSVLENLSYTEFGKMMVPGETVVVFDGIQACGRAFTALKPLAMDGRFDFIASGSMIGFDLPRGSGTPMGYVTVVDMFPMDFEEFLWAVGFDREKTGKIRSRISTLAPFGEFQLSKLLDLFMRYLAVGGMPEAVSKYVETGNYRDVPAIFDRILSALRADAMKYPPRGERLRILSCLESIPGQLAKGNGTFSYYGIEHLRGYGRRIYGYPMDWSVESGFAYRVSNLAEPRGPLRGNVKRGSFKMFVADTGLLAHMLGPDVAASVMDGDHTAANGAVMGNALCNMLASAGYETYFFRKPNSTLELDSVIEYDGRTVAIKVRTGRYDYPKSLITVMGERYGVGSGILLSKDDIFTDSYGVLHLPLFAPAFFDPVRVPDIPPMDIDVLNAELG